VEHRQLPLELDSYELEEVYAPWSTAEEPATVIRITLHGKNILVRALEPTVKIGDVLVQYPDIASDERRIIGFLVDTPKEGSPITLEFGGKHASGLDQTFTLRKLKRLRRDRNNGVGRDPD